MREMVLMINFKDEEKRRAIQAILLSKKIYAKRVSKEEYAQPIGALAGNTALYREGAVYEGEDLDRDMMIFVGLPNAKLDYVLAMMRKKKSTRVDYKAVLTPTNQNWLIPDLYQELAKEHHYMQSRFKKTENK